MTRQCRTPWGVCALCLGQGLERSGSRCWCPACFRRYPERDFDGPCRLPVATLLEDEDGTVGAVCASHAAHARTAGLKKRPAPKRAVWT